MIQILLKLCICLFLELRIVLTGHPCQRECDGSPKTCVYTFNVTLETSMNLDCQQCPIVAADCSRIGCIPGGGIVRPVIAVNLNIPGPSLMVCENDSMVVHVYNNLRTETISIHWHGLHQVNTFFSDGLPMVSQMPIIPRDHHTYMFKAHPAGTHMWHGHSSFQEADGLFGPFVVRRKESNYVKSLYDFDLPEHTIIVWHWFNHGTADVLVPIFHTNGSVSGFGLLINGKAAFKEFQVDEGQKTFTTPRETFFVEQGYRYRFRLIFNSAIYCPIEVSIDQHQLLMFSTETSNFEPLKVDSFMVTSGERFDFVVNASNAVGCYTMRFRGYGDCGKTNVTELAYLCYNQSTIEETFHEQEEVQQAIILNPIEEATRKYINKTLVHLTDLNNRDVRQGECSGIPDVTIYTQVHTRLYNSFRFPGSWHQFDNVTFLNPDVSFLKSNMDVAGNSFCTDDTIKDYCLEDFCQCTYIKTIPLNSLVELILVDITLDRNQDHPVHLHGYSFYVVAMEAVGTNISLSDIKMKNEKGLLKKNLKTAITKDTISVPNRGYAIIRFKATNPGFWLFHCHVSNHLELGMALLFQVGDRQEIIKMCKNLDECGLSLSSSHGSLTRHLISLYIVILTVTIVIS